MAADKLVDSTQLNGAMTATANAIRSKTGDSSQIAWDMTNGFASAISPLEIKHTAYFKLSFPTDIVRSTTLPYSADASNPIYLETDFQPKAVYYANVDSPTNIYNDVRDSTETSVNLLGLYNVFSAEDGFVSEPFYAGVGIFNRNQGVEFARITSTILHTEYDTVSHIWKTQLYGPSDMIRFTSHVPNNENHKIILMG